MSCKVAEKQWLNSMHDFKIVSSTLAVHVFRVAKRIFPGRAKSDKILFYLLENKKTTIFC